MRNPYLVSTTRDLVLDCIVDNVCCFHNGFHLVSLSGINVYPHSETETVSYGSRKYYVSVNIELLCLKESKILKLRGKRISFVVVRTKNPEKSITMI